VADAFFVVSATLVAVTVKEVGADTEGAVRTPLEETVPDVADQVTAVLLVPDTVAIKDGYEPDGTLAFCGVTLTLMPLPPPEVPPNTLKVKVFDPEASRGRLVTRTVNV